MRLEWVPNNDSRKINIDATKQNHIIPYVHMHAKPGSWRLFAVVASLRMRMMNEFVAESAPKCLQLFSERRKWRR